MAVVLRLKRMGTNKRPFWRIVATDKRNPRDGRFIEEIGYYDTKKNPSDIKVNKEKALYWLGKGARPTETVRNIFKKAKVYAEK